MLNSLNYYTTRIVVVIFLVPLLSFSQLKERSESFKKEMLWTLIQAEKGDKKSIRKSKKLIASNNVRHIELAEYYKIIGKLFNKGIEGTVKKDNEKAASARLKMVNCYKECIDQDSENTSCLVKLGVVYYVQKTEDAYKKAFTYFLRAAKLGSDKAQYVTGRCYLQGEGVEFNLQEGYSWFTKSARQGNKDAIKILRSLDDDLSKLNKKNNKPKRVTSASGVYVSPNHILTVYHAVDKENTFAVFGSDKKVQKAELIYKSESKDLALLRVEIPSDNYISLETLAVNKINKNDSIFIPKLYKGYFYLMKGKLLNENITVEDETKSLKRIEIETSSVKNGDSGSPILNQELKLVGILSDIISEDRNVNNVKHVFGIKVIDIYRFLVENNVKLPIKENHYSGDKDLYLENVIVEVAGTYVEKEKR